MSSEKLNNKRALTILEVSEYSCVSRGTVHNWISQRLLPFEELPGRGEGSQRFIRIRKEDLDTFLDSYYKKPYQVIEDKRQEDLILLPKNS